MFYVPWAIALIYMIGLGLAIPFGVFALAISPTKGRTLKRMALVFITVSPSIVVLGILAAGTSQSRLVARATGLLCVPVWPDRGNYRRLESCPVAAEARA